LPDWIARHSLMVAHAPYGEVPWPWLDEHTPVDQATRDAADAYQAENSAMR
jgi:hypothetical protein